MTGPSNNNTRIAKNTVFLSFRMLFMTAVALYTSRIVLQVLGTEDFGIYNVVAGTVTMLSFFNSSLAVSTQRFLNYEMGRNNTHGLNSVFINAVNAHCIIGFVSVLALETFGLWFMYNKLNIPTAQFEAAIRVFHFSVLSFFISIIGTPYNACIVANEKMGVYAYYSIIEAILKLLVVLLLVIIPYNKLTVYGVLTLGVTVVMQMLYATYCIGHFKECTYKWKWEKTLLKKMFSFSSWLFLGCISDLFSKQGVNILINIFFGPAFNAARGIAIQVQNAVNMFVTNFMTAVRPQIVKSYSAGEYRHMYRLVFSSSKLSYYLLFLLTTPVLLYTDSILNLWLTEVPECCVLFTRLVLIELLISSAYVPIAQVNQASGKVKNYQFAIAVIFFLTFILTYVSFKLEMPVSSAFVISLIFAVVGLFVRVWILKKENGFPASSYLLKVMLPLVPVSLIALIVPITVRYFSATNFLTACLNMLIGFVTSIISIWFLGLDKDEKFFVREKVIAVKDKIINR